MPTTGITNFTLWNMSETARDRLPDFIYSEIDTSGDLAGETYDGGGGIDTLLLFGSDNLHGSVSLSNDGTGMLDGSSNLIGIENVFWDFTGDVFVGHFMDGNDQSNWFALSGTDERAIALRLVNTYGGDDIITFDGDLYGITVLNAGSGDDLVFARNTGSVQIYDDGLTPGSSGDDLYIFNNDGGDLTGSLSVSYFGQYIGNDEISGFDGDLNAIHLQLALGGYTTVTENGNHSTIHVFSVSGVETGSILVDAVGLELHTELGQYYFI